jgi:hypothetical protein
MDRVFGFIAENPMAAVIVDGEIAFWVFIIVGLAHRFAGGPAPEKRKKTGHENTVPNGAPGVNASSLA